MKYVVASDLHGYLDAYSLLNDICEKVRPDRLILLGDLSRYGYMDETIKMFIRQLPLMPVVVKGNCDRDLHDIEEIDYVGEYHIEYKFGRNLFFTHGDRYNIANIPPVLKEGDVLIYGHTHLGGSATRAGVKIVNCGSLGSPRDNFGKTYITIDDGGITSTDVETNEKCVLFAF